MAGTSLRQRHTHDDNAIALVPLSGTPKSIFYPRLLDLRAIRLCWIPLVSFGSTRNKNGSTATNVAILPTQQNKPVAAKRDVSEPADLVMTSTAWHTRMSTAPAARLCRYRKNVKNQVDNNAIALVPERLRGDVLRHRDNCNDINELYKQRPRKESAAA